MAFIAVPGGRIDAEGAKDSHAADTERNSWQSLVSWSPPYNRAESARSSGVFSGTSVSIKKATCVRSELATPER